MTTPCYLTKVVAKLQHSQPEMREWVQVRGFTFGSEDFSFPLKHTILKDYNDKNQQVSLKAAMSISIWSSLEPSHFRQLTYLEITYESLKAGEQVTS